jgi:hypothetical protein
MGQFRPQLRKKVNIFADILEQIDPNSDVDRIFTVSTDQTVNDFLKQPLTDRVRATNHSEIAWIVRHLKPRTAAGPDGIQNIILQHLPRLKLRGFSPQANYTNRATAACRGS